MAVEQALVQLPRTNAQLGALGEPADRPLRNGDGPVSRVDPGSTRAIGSFSRSKGLRFTLGAEGTGVDPAGGVSSSPESSSSLPSSRCTSSTSADMGTRRDLSIRTERSVPADIGW
jgi:hypothetical protein